MRARVLVIALLALTTAGSAAAAPHAKPKLVSVVKHYKAITATLTYKDDTSVKEPPALEYSDVQLTIWKRGHRVLHRRICHIGGPRHEPYRCKWDATALADAGFEIRDLGGRPLVQLSIWDGCADQVCFDDFMAHVGTGYTTWAPHRWLGAGFRMKRIRGRTLFLSYDGRFKCAFTSCCCSTLPVRIWRFEDFFGLVDVTGSRPGFVRHDARRIWREYLADNRGQGDQTHGVGILAAWCADEYLLKKGSRCQHELQANPDLTQQDIAGVNRQLQQWDYEPKPVSVTKTARGVTATLTYVWHHHVAYNVALSVWLNGTLSLQRKVQQPFGPLIPTLNLRRVAGHGPPAAVIDSYMVTYIALVSPQPAWIEQDWSRSGYRGKVLHGRYSFITGDGHFWCSFASCAESWAPVQVLAIQGVQLVDVTKTVPGVVLADARHAWRWYRRAARDAWGRGVGVLAGWCADEFLLGRGSRCERVLRQKLVAGDLKSPEDPNPRRFIRMLNRDLVRWGYKRG